MKRNCSQTVFTSLIILFLGCQDPVGLLPTLSSPSAEPAVKSIKAGTVVGPTDTLPLSLSYDSSTDPPDLLVVTIYRQDDTSNQTPVSKVSISGSDLSASPMRPLSLGPDLPRGAYKIEFVLSRKGTVISRSVVPFFYEPQPYSIQSVRAYPSTLGPGADGLLEVSVVSGSPFAGQSGAAVPGPTAAVNTSDYFVRWWDGDKLLSSGSYGAGNNVYHLTAPAKDGVYSYRVEVFPVAPSEAGDISFSSSISKEIRVVVSSTDLAAGGFGPENDYATLLHFQGNLTDRGWETQGSKLFNFQGQRFFNYRADTIGYTIGNGSVLVADQTWLPAGDGDSVSYGVFTRFIPLNLATGNIVKMSSQDGGSSLLLAAEADGFLSLDYRGLGLSLSAQSVAPVLRVDTPVLLQSFVSTYGGVLTIVVQDGNKTVLKVSQKLAKSNVSTSAPKGRTEIGNTGGFKMLVDEFGVYRPRIEKLGEDLFSLAMYYRYGESLRLAEDFATDKAPEGFATSGDVRFVESQAMLYGGSTLSLPSMGDLNKLLRFELLFNPQSDLTKTSLTIWTGGNASDPLTDPVVLNLSGEIVYQSKRLALTGFERNPLTFSIDPKNGKTQLSWAGKTLGLDWVLSDSSKLHIRLGQSAETPIAVSLDSVLSVAEAGQDLIEK